MELSQIAPLVRYAKLHKQFLHVDHYVTCRDCRLFFFRHAEGHIRLDGRQYKIGDGTVVFLPPNTRYRFVMNPKNPGDAYVINFDITQENAHLSEKLLVATDDELPDIGPSITQAPPEYSRVSVRTTTLTADLLMRCIDEMMAKKPYYRELASSYIRAYLIELQRDVTTVKPRLAVQNAQGVIAKHFDDPTLSNESIAAMLGYHPYYLSKLFKDTLGLTLNQYLLRYRIQSAQFMLTHSGYDVETVAWKCGFNSSAYFIKRFREKVGMTPKRYALSHTVMGI